MSFPTAGAVLVPILDWAELVWRSLLETVERDRLLENLIQCTRRHFSLLSSTTSYLT